MLSYIRALDYLFKPFVSKYLILSGILSLGIFLLLAGIIFQWGDNLGMSIVNGISGSSMEDGILKKIIRALSVLSLWTGLFLVFKYLVIIITAPVMSVLSEKLEARLSGKQAPSVNIMGQLYLMVRGLRIAISNLGREISLTILLLLLGLIPGFAIVTIPLIFVVQSYYAGFGNFDLFMERHFNVSQSRRFISNHKSYAAANGSVFLLVLLIPFIGAFLAPALATISATLLGMELLEDN